MKTAKRKPSWGGIRKGAGRKPLTESEPTEKRTVVMPKSYWGFAEQLGNGNISVGIRRIVEEAMKHE